MKRIKILLFLFLLANGVSLFAWSPAPRTPVHRRCVQVPLDGGLLAVLGVAGIAYYLVRRKRNKKDQ